MMTSTASTLVRMFKHSKFIPHATLTTKIITSRNIMKRATTATTALTPTTSSSSSAALSKVIAQKYSLSRRKAENLIRDGQVKISGTTIYTPYTKVPPNCTVKLSNKPAHMIDGDNNSSSPPTTRVWMAHKISGELVTENDPSNRPSLLERIVIKDKSKKRRAQKIPLKPIGRLDMSTEGLLLLTNDGQYARDLELPKNAIRRTYRARVHGFLTMHKLNSLRRGLVDKDGVRYKGLEVRVDMLQSVGGRKRREEAANSWLTITCVEGKNRQIRKMLQHVGLRVTRLIRTAFGDYSLDKLPPGMIMEVPVKPMLLQKNRGIIKKTTRTTQGLNNRKKYNEKGTAATTSSPVQWIKVA